MKIIHFPRWAEVLKASDLSEKVQSSYNITLRWYLGWCRNQGTGCSVDSARAFVEWAKREKRVDDQVVEHWKAAIRWFLIKAKEP
ncbi:MAG: hypothetical protein ACJAT5_000203 [Lentimonas sp.]|jgi:hypothetical protein